MYNTRCKLTAYPTIALLLPGLVLCAAALPQRGLRADDWMTWASTYTHDPYSGYRVDQFAAGEQPQAPNREDFSRSGYRHYRSTLQAGQSADNLHVVEQWGRPVVPYEQWRFPFRPYAVPYDAWGPQAPYGITNGSFQFGVGASPPPNSGAGYTNPYGPGNPGPGIPGAGIPGAGNMGQPNFGYGAGAYGGGFGPGAFAPTPNASRGFPLTPTYNNEPWYDGTWPSAPPLGGR